MTAFKCHHFGLYSCLTCNITLYLPVALLGRNKKGGTVYENKVKNPFFFRLKIGRDLLKGGPFFHFKHSGTNLDTIAFHTSFRALSER